MDRKFLEAIGEVNRARRLLDEAGGSSALARQMAEASRAATIFEAAGKNDRLGLLAAGHEPDLMRASKAFSEKFAAVEAARGFVQPNAIEFAAGSHAMSIVNQAHLLGLPELSMPMLKNFGQFQEMAQSARDIAAAMQPTKSILHDMSRQIAEITEPHRRIMEQFKWADDLERRMNLIDLDWARADRLAISGLSFAELARFSDIVHFDTPYSDETNEIVFEELGEIVEVLEEDPVDREAQYDCAGRKGALVAFPDQSYGRVVVAAGFALEFPTAPTPQPIRNVPTGVLMDVVHYAAMTHLENHLRYFVASRLAEADSNWLKSRVPGSVRTRLMERQKEADQQGHPVYELFFYGDLGDLGEVMKQANNWPLFEPYFGGRDGLGVSISRLIPIRNNIAHGRPLSQTDILNIAAEGYRLLRAMGIVSVQ